MSSSSSSGRFGFAVRATPKASIIETIVSIINFQKKWGEHALSPGRKELPVEGHNFESGAFVALLGHLRDMYRKIRLWQQRRQFERLESVSRNLGVPINPRFAVRCLMTSVQILQKGLRRRLVHLSTLGPRDHCFTRVRSHQLRPVLFQQTRAREKIRPHDLSVHRDHYANRLAIA